MSSFESNTANLFDLAGESLRISYSTSSFSGEPQLSIEHDETSHLFRGDQIDISESAIGTLVSVTLSAIPDLESETMSLLLPTVNLPRDASEVDVETIAILVTRRTSIGGPALVSGQIELYQTEALSGTARSVDF